MYNVLYLGMFRLTNMGISSILATTGYWIKDKGNIMHNTGLQDTGYRIHDTATGYIIQDTRYT